MSEGTAVLAAHKGFKTALGSPDFTHDWDGQPDGTQQITTANTPAIILASGAGNRAYRNTPFAGHTGRAAEMDGSTGVVASVTYNSFGDIFTAQVYFQFDLIPVTSAAFIRLWDTTLANNLVSLRWSAATKTFGVVNNASTLVGSNTSKVWTDGEQCRIDMQFVKRGDAVGDFFARLFYGSNIEGTVPDETIGGTGINTGAGQHFMGVQMGVTQAIAGKYTFDDVRVWRYTVAAWPTPLITFTTHQGAVTATETSALTVGATRELTPTANLTQTTSLVIGGTREQFPTVAATETTSLNVAGVRDQPAAVTATETTSLVVAATTSTVLQGTVTATETTTLSVSAVRSAVATVSAVEVTDLTVSALRTVLPTVTATEVTSLVVSAVREQFGAVTATETTSLVVTADVTRQAAATLTEVTSLVVAGLRTALPTVAATEVTSLIVAATVTQLPTANLVEVSSLIVGAQSTYAGAATLTEVTSLVVSAERVLLPTASLAEVTALAVSGVVARVATVSATETTSLVVAATATRLATVTATEITSLIIAAVRETAYPAQLMTDAQRFGTGGWNVVSGTLSTTGDGHTSIITDGGNNPRIFSNNPRSVVVPGSIQDSYVTVRNDSASSVTLRLDVIYSLNAATVDQIVGPTHVLAAGETYTFPVARTVTPEGANNIYLYVVRSGTGVPAGLQFTIMEASILSVIGLVQTTTLTVGALVLKAATANLTENTSLAVTAARLTMAAAVLTELTQLTVAAQVIESGWVFGLPFR